MTIPKDQPELWLAILNFRIETQLLPIFKLSCKNNLLKNTLLICIKTLFPLFYKGFRIWESPILISSKALNLKPNNRGNAGKMPKKLRDKIKEMPIESQLKIESRAQELIALELSRRNLKQLKH